MITSITVWLQAIAAGIFLIRYTHTHKWWRHGHGRVLGLMAISLFMLTLDLAITDANEGLGNTPWPVVVGRLGFGIAMLYGITLDGKKR